MKLESVRSLKSEVAETMLRPMIRELRATRAFGVPAGVARRYTGIEPAMALGIGRGARSAGDRARDFRLAVRLQRRALESDAGLRQRLERMARHEVDLRYIGRVGKRQAKPWQQTRQRPLRVGVSIGHFAVTAGTLGGFVRGADGAPALLSNNHVIANEDRARVGDTILQPGVRDRGERRRDRIARLAAWKPLAVEEPNLIDAAVATLLPRSAFEPSELRDIGVLGGVRSEPLEPGDEVAKVGRTTGSTRGRVTAIELDDVVVEYDRGALRFDRQVEIESTGELPFSSGGDSGSVIVDGEGRACALLFAGSDQGGANGKGLTFANELGLVLDELAVTLVTEGPTA